MYLSKVSILAFSIGVLFLCSGFIAPTSTSLNNDQDHEVMTAGLFKIQGRLNAIIENFDFDFKCGVSEGEIIN